MYPGFLYNFTYLGLFISYILEIILLGKLTYSITSSTLPSNTSILKEKWANYLIVTILVILPSFLIAHLASLLSFSPYSIPFIEIGISFLMAALTIYVLPIAFLKNENIKAILVGVYYLFTNFTFSKPILFMLLAALFIKLIPVLIIMSFPFMGIYGIIPTMIASNIVATYIFILIFSAATITLVQNNNEIQEQA